MGPSRLRGQTEGSYLEFSCFRPGIDAGPDHRDVSSDGRDQLVVMPTTGWLIGIPPAEPKKGALKAKRPPSEATSQ